MIVVIFVFLAAFAMFALLLYAFGGGNSQQKKQVSGRLDALLVSEKRSVNENLTNIRKQETLSAIPLLNRFLATVEVAPRLRELLSQANLAWTP